MKDYRAACRYIEDAARFGSRPGLERIRDLCERLGHPEKELRFVHIAGTNGKGSTGAMIASALKEAGLRTGMYYSPAMSGIRDHYMINGRLISEEDYAGAVSRVAAANDLLISETGESATQFELETAVAFSYFSENHCDVVVLECGMGGRDDATNVACGKICCVLTSISYDHMQYLGDTLTDIAGAKAGIITKGCPTAALESGSEVTDVIKLACKEKNSPLHIVDPKDITYTADSSGQLIVSYKEFENVKVNLSGSFQAENAALAVAALSVIAKSAVFGEKIPGEDAIRRGLENVSWPFRFEKISQDPLMYVDGAHNAGAASQLLETIKGSLAGYEIILVMGMFADKEVKKVVATLASKACTVIATQTPDNTRALDAGSLAGYAQKYCGHVIVCKDIKKAYDLAVKECKKHERAAVVACGSLSYLNDFKNAENR